MIHKRALIHMHTHTHILFNSNLGCQGRRESKLPWQQFPKLHNTTHTLGGFFFFSREMKLLYLPPCLYLNGNVTWWASTLARKSRELIATLFLGSDSASTLSNVAPPSFHNYVGLRQGQTREARIKKEREKKYSKIHMAMHPRRDTWDVWTSIIICYIVSSALPGKVG